METEWVGFGISVGSWLIMAGMAIVVFILGWWFYMPNPMSQDRKDRNKKPQGGQE